MTAALVSWFWSLASQDMALVIGLGLIASAFVMAISKKIGKWI